MAIKKVSKKVKAAAAEQPATKAAAPKAAAPKAATAKAAPAKKVAKVDSTKAAKEKKKQNAVGLSKEGFTYSLGIAPQEFLIPEDKNWAAMLATILGTPGPVKGKFIEIAAKSDQGKSALADTIGAIFQRQGVEVGKIDIEGSMTDTFAASLGYDVSKFHYTHPFHGEGAFRAMRELLSRNVGYMVLDSTAACIPESQILTDNNDMSALARLLTKELNKVDPLVRLQKSVVVMISQVKEKPGVSFGNPEYVTGGNAPGFHSRVRMQLRTVEKQKDDLKQETTKTIRITITKNHTGPKRTIPFDIVVDNLFRPQLAETAVAWAEKFGFLDKDKGTICGIEYSGKGKYADAAADAIRGKERTVFEAVDGWFKAKEAGNLSVSDYEKTDDSTDTFIEGEEKGE